MAGQIHISCQPSGLHINCAYEIKLIVN